MILDQWESSAIGSNITRFVNRIHESKYVLIIGAPSYEEKLKNIPKDDLQHGYIVSTEADL